MNRRTFCLTSLLSLPSLSSFARALAQPTLFNGRDALHFTLESPLDHPFYAWPTTLLAYPLRFEHTIDTTRLRLTDDATGEPLPTQLSNLTPTSATLHFLANLPANTRRSFTLTLASTPQTHAPQVHAHAEGASLILDTGQLRIRIPSSQPIHSSTAPAPIQQLCRSTTWIGDNTLTLTNNRIATLTNRRLASGPLFLTCELTYTTTSGSRYTATVQAIAGYDHVYLHEDIDDLTGVLTTLWTSFHPTHRQSPNHPEPGIANAQPYDNYPWERIDQTLLNRDTRFGSPNTIYPDPLPPGELPFTLGIYQASSESIILPAANFWDDQTSDALGIFIPKTADWQDFEYANEVAADTLQVHYVYRDNLLHFHWPIAHGRRSTALAFYDHAQDKLAQQALEHAAHGVDDNGLNFRIQLDYTSHTTWLQNLYGPLHLNTFKDWQLTYPETAARPPIIFPSATTDDPGELVARILTSRYVCTLPITGTREDDGFSATKARQILDPWVCDYNRLQHRLTPAQRRRLTAAFLLLAHIHAGDEYLPLTPMLGGHPNYMSDVKGAVPAMSFLFPAHPLAAAWLEMWAKWVVLCTRYNTRPAVTAWNAEGGRWTENLGTYVWAFLRPAMRAGFLATQHDGVQRLVSPQLAALADWLVNALSAPFNGETEQAWKTLNELDYGHQWGAVAPGNGPRRVHPPLGAHSERRMPPRTLWAFGQNLRNYAPLAAEHAMWSALPTDQDMETAPGYPPPWGHLMYTGPENRGTNPHLRSRKHTGYGIVLRSAVSTPDEVSLHLQQIDEGPNYRWGWPAEGSCGLLYFFAAGQAYSFNGSEDAGDRRNQDTDYCTNFGVFKDGEFRAIGKNVLSSPMYPLAVAQFAQITARTGPTTYSAPEYLSRSLLLAGHDYFLLYDHVAHHALQHRLSWFTRNGSELPSITLLRGGDGDPRHTHATKIEGDATHGLWFDGMGDSMALVSHRKDLIIHPTRYGCTVKAAPNSSTNTPGIDDLLFRSPDSMVVHIESGPISFTGTAGLVRRTSVGYDFAFFHSTHLDLLGYTFATNEPNVGLSGSLATDPTAQSPRGDFFSPDPFTLFVTSPATAHAPRFCIDGAPQPDPSNSNTLTLQLPAGHHNWELTAATPIPIAPQILRTENRSGGARVILSAVASATHYRLEISHDNGATWTTHATPAPSGPSALDPVPSALDPAPTATVTLQATNLTNGEKVHLRAIALNAEHESLPGHDYPLYVTADPPPPPDGLRATLTDGVAALTWGELLGAHAYRLYARTRGLNTFALLYEGLDRTYTHHDPRIHPCAEKPAPLDPPPSDVIEYTVTALNLNGESLQSRLADTNPNTWRNWDPRPNEPFRRVYSFVPNTPPDPTSWPRYYPK
jgi:hypothetical protein